MRMTLSLLTLSFRFHVRVENSTMEHAGFTFKALKSSSTLALLTHHTTDFCKVTVTISAS